VFRRFRAGRPRVLLGVLAVTFLAALLAVMTGGPKAYASGAVSPRADSTYYPTTTWTAISQTHRCTSLGSSGGVQGVVCVDVRAVKSNGTDYVKPEVELYCQGGGLVRCSSTSVVFKLFEGAEGMGSPTIYPATNAGCGAGYPACSSGGRNIFLGPQVADTAAISCNHVYDGRFTWWTEEEGVQIVLPNGAVVADSNVIATPSVNVC
jgi:hypothetical protein